MSVNKVNSDGSTTLIAGGTLWADSPIGTILTYGGATAPAGWFICQGQELTKTEYADLYAVIGDSFGTASVNTKFKLPDLREATTKGVGLTGKSNNHMDADGLALGEFIDDRVQEHYHYNGGSNASSGSNVAGASGSASGASNNMVVYPTSARKGATTEVKSVGVNYIIKAKQVALPADLESAVEKLNSPDWSNKQTVTLSTTDYTVPDDGWFVCEFVNSGTQVSLMCNDLRVATSFGSSYGCFQMKVTKGDRFSFNGSSINYQNAYFVPHK